MRRVPGIRENGGEARQIHMGKIRRFGEFRMVRYTEMRRKDAAGGRKPARVHTHPGVGMFGDGIEERRRGRFVRIHKSDV